MTPSPHDIAYLDLLRSILRRGTLKENRTGVRTYSVFGAQLRFDLQRGFPLLTTKRIAFRLVAEELLWFLRGSTNEHELRDRGVHIWQEWATEEQCAKFGRGPGDLGPVYGHQWRKFGQKAPIGIYRVGGDEGTDQIANALQLLKDSPDSRRIIVSAWNPKEATQVTLPPCHTLFQFGTEQQADGRLLHCHMFQRSADMFLGVPFNIASYALLTHMFAHVLGYTPGHLVISFSDAHIYENHVEQVEEQLERKPRLAPRVWIDRDPNEYGTLLERTLKIQWEDIKVGGYDPHPKISAPVAV